MSFLKGNSEHKKLSIPMQKWIYNELIYINWALSATPTDNHIRGTMLDRGCLIGDKLINHTKLNCDTFN